MYFEPLVQCDRSLCLAGDDRSRLTPFAASKSVWLDEARFKAP